MNEHNARLRVKLGGAEIEYEGREQFLKEEVMPTVVAKIFGLAQTQSELRQPSEVRTIEPPQKALPTQGNADRKSDHSTGRSRYLHASRTSRSNEERFCIL